MSTDSDSPKPNPDQQDRFQKIKMSAQSHYHARSTAEVELENDLATERDGRREDRFLFVVALVVIFDVWALQSVTTWTLPIVVGIIELFALLIFARRMGVEEIHFWLNQLLPRISLGVRKPEPSGEESDTTKRD
ncbi:hypothetical protein [Billgrantia sp. C5P2]|uniref:hypothetical protein n=1 Tax=Billgrantia sp. C5P2 TaxID=3436239 RepID=UPI003DA4D32D